MRRLEPNRRPPPQLRSGGAAERDGEAFHHGVDHGPGGGAVRFDTRPPRVGASLPDEGRESRRRPGSHVRQSVRVDGRERRANHARTKALVGHQPGQLGPRGELGLGRIVGENGQSRAQHGGCVTGLGVFGGEAGDEAGHQRLPFAGRESAEAVHENGLLGAETAPGDETQQALPHAQRADPQGGGIGVSGRDARDGEVAVQDAADRGATDVRGAQDADQVKAAQGRVAIAVVARWGAVGGRQELGVE